LGFDGILVSPLVRAGQIFVVVVSLPGRVRWFAITGLSFRISPSLWRPGTEVVSPWPPFFSDPFLSLLHTQPPISYIGGDGSLAGSFAPFFICVFPHGPLHLKPPPLLVVRWL